MAGMARARLDPFALSRVRGVVAKGFRAPPIRRRPFPRGIAGRIAENVADDVFSCGAGISCCPLPRRSRFVAFSCEGGNIILSAAGSMLVYFYARGPRLNNGKIGVFCTFGQKTSTFLARYSRNVPSDSVFFGSKRTKYAYFAKIGCPGVHFSEILPESCSLAALGYIWRRFRHVSAFRPGIAHWGKPCLALSDMFPRSAQGSPVVWGLRDCPCIGPRYRLSHSARNRSWHRPPGGGRLSHTGGSATRSQPRRPLRYNRSRKHA